MNECVTEWVNKWINFKRWKWWNLTENEHYECSYVLFSMNSGCPKRTRSKRGWGYWYLCLQTWCRPTVSVHITHLISEAETELNWCSLYCYIKVLLFKVSPFLYHNTGCSMVCPILYLRWSVTIWHTQPCLSHHISSKYVFNLLMRYIVTWLKTEAGDLFMPGKMPFKLYKQ